MSNFPAIKFVAPTPSVPGPARPANRGLMPRRQVSAAPSFFPFPAKKLVMPSGRMPGPARPTKRRLMSKVGVSAAPSFFPASQPVMPIAIMPGRLHVAETHEARGHPQARPTCGAQRATCFPAISRMMSIAESPGPARPTTLRMMPKIGTSAALPFSSKPTETAERP